MTIPTPELSPELIPVGTNTYGKNEMIHNTVYDFTKRPNFNLFCYFLITYLTSLLELYSIWLQVEIMIYKIECGKAFIVSQL